MARVRRQLQQVPDDFDKVVLAAAAAVIDAIEHDGPVAVTSMLDDGTAVIDLVSRG